MAGVTVPIHAPVIDWIMQNVHEDQVAPDVLDQLNAWKTGEKQPTLKQLEAMSRKTRIPFGYFLLQTPPDEDIALDEYRTVGSKKSQKPSRELIDILDQMTAIQDWMRDELKREQSDATSFVGSGSLHDSTGEIAQRIRDDLGLKTNWYREGKNAEDNFNRLRNTLVQHGLLIFTGGKVGANTHRPLDVKEFRLYNKCCGDTNCIFAAFIFFPKRGENMIKPTEFVNYVDRLPDDCVESITDGEIHFHLPHPGHVTCPFCRSTHIGVHQYRPQVLRGIPGATKRYVYNRRRYRCHDCGKTFVEESPFLASFQRRIGNRLRQIRARKKLSQREVIESIGIPFHLYVKYEDDVEPEIPSTLVAMKIAECLGTDVLDIWGDQLK